MWYLWKPPKPIYSKYKVGSTHNYMMRPRFYKSFMKFLRVVKEELRIQVYTHIWHLFVYTAIYTMLCYRKSQTLFWPKYEIGDAQLHGKIHILWNFHYISLSGLGGNTDMKVATDRRTPPSLYTTRLKAEFGSGGINMWRYF